MPRKIILKCMLSPGDICTLTAAIESLHLLYPAHFLTDVRTTCDELFEHSPRITHLADNEAELIDMHYTELINHSDQRPNIFLRGYAVNCPASDASSSPADAVVSCGAGNLNSRARRMSRHQQVQELRRHRTLAYFI